MKRPFCTLDSLVKMVNVSRAFEYPLYAQGRHSYNMEMKRQLNESVAQVI
jgi:hypothetical protein